MPRRLEELPHQHLLRRAHEIAALIAANPAHSVQAVMALYDEVAELAPPQAWTHENERARRWIANRFDKASLAERRERFAQGEAQGNQQDEPQRNVPMEPRGNEEDEPRRHEQDEPHRGGNHEAGYEQIFKCPLCETPQRRRHQRLTGEAFWGCSRYPSCKGTSRFAGVDMSDEIRRRMQANAQQQVFRGD